MLYEKNNMKKEKDAGKDITIRSSTSEYAGGNYPKISDSSI
jgi:hypothetical protein